MLEKGPILICTTHMDEGSSIQEAFSEEDAFPTIACVSGFAKFFKYLDGLGIYSNRNRFPYPVIVLLDFDMANDEALKILCWINAEPPVKPFLIFGLGTNTAPRVIQEAYDRGLNGFFSSPGDVSTMVRLLFNIEKAPGKLQSESDRTSEIA